MDLSIPLIIMNFVFLASASFQIGTGHIMRLLPIAEQLVARGYSATFIADQIEVPWLRNKLLLLGPQISLCEGIYSPNPLQDILIVDSYLIDTSDKFYKSENWLFRVSVGDDNTPDYGFQLTILPGFDEMKVVKSPFRMIASGKDYFLFRNSIRTWRANRFDKNSSPNKIMISGEELIQLSLDHP